MHVYRNYIYINKKWVIVLDNFEPSNLFEPVVWEWFSENIGRPSPPQVEGWPYIKNGSNVLIIAPTGAGKTLSAFMVCINELFKDGMEGRLGNTINTVYISPLKALNNDIYRNLEVPLQGIRDLCAQKGIACPEITKAVRTGDTPSRDRQKMLKTPPNILITTPESLYLLLTSSKASQMLMDVKSVIIDEIHTLFNNKRGAHLALSIERLEHLVGRPVQRIGLSATVKPAEEAAKYLGGFRKTGGVWWSRPVKIVKPDMGRSADLRIVTPVKDYRTLKEGTVWPDIYNRILDLVGEHKSTLIFVNGRATAEKVAANLNSIAGRVIAKTHHGCVSKEVRLEVERDLKAGKLPCLVATSSLELGIDIGAIDLVVQVASPKSVSRGLQRLGRAGHRLSATSKCRIIPRTRADLLESAIISREMLKGSIEEERIPHAPLDILSQQLVAMSCTRDWAIDEIRDVIMSAYSYQDLTMDELEGVLSMLNGDFEHHEDAPRAPRLIWDRINKTIRGNNYSRMLALGGCGTIPDRGYYSVYLDDNRTKLGELDETFVYEARLGDKFMLGTSSWRIEKIRHDRVIVSKSNAMGAKTPFWTGEGLGRPYEMGIRVGAFLREISEKAGTKDYLPWISSFAPVDEDGGRNLEQYILDQKNADGCLATDKRIVVEYFSDEVGEKRAVIHSPFGGRVNCGIAIALEKVLGDELHCQVQASHSDDGVLINMMGAPSDCRNILSLLSPDNIESIIINRLPETPLFSMGFRYNAARALMMGTKKVGKRSPLWIQRIKALETLQIAERFTNHPLIVETLRECMETVLDVPSLTDVLKRIKCGDIEIFECTTSHPSPFTHELLFNFMGVMMYEGQIPDPRKIRDDVLSGRGALHLKYPRFVDKSLINSDAVQGIIEKNNPLLMERQVKSPDELHSLLAAYGDLRMDEKSKPALMKICTGDVEEWLNELKTSGRAYDFTCPDGHELWVAGEETAMYSYAFNSESGAGYEAAADEDISWTREEALSRIVRRFARFYSPFTVEELTGRYPVQGGIIGKVLSRLKEDGIIVEGDFTGQNMDELCHHVVLERIRKQSMAISRAAVRTNNINTLSRLIMGCQGIGREMIAPVESLYDAIIKLKGLYLPVEWWEDFIFPTRINGYKQNMIDKLCASGRVIWRIKKGETNPYLAWFGPEDISDGDDDINIESLNENEAAVFNILKRRGACFLHTICALSSMDTTGVLNNLQSLVWKGLIVNDSFESIRYFNANTFSSPKARAKMTASAFKADMGRWEIAREIKEYDIRDMIGIWLGRYGIITKEILQCEKSSFPWGDVYDALKNMEYTGEVERGYYIEGISGIQFTKNGTSAGIGSTNSGYFVLNSCDPAQVFGRIAPKDNASSWLCVPGTALVLKDGGAILSIESFGEKITPYTENREDILGAVKAFKTSFETGRMWRGRKRIIVKQWQDTTPSKCSFAAELETMGFEPEMQDMVLWKKL
jgi:Lhr-like helicases